MSEEKINVVVAIDFSEEIMQRIRDVSPRFNVVQHFPNVPSSVWANTEILYTVRDYPAPEEAPMLRWIQLNSAGVERARAIVIGTGRDADNVFIALCARDLNPDIQVHARAETETGERRLRNAGAEQIVSPLQVGGHRIANALVRPAVLDFIELTDPGRGAEIDLEEVLVTDDGDLEGCAVGDLGEQGVLLVVGLRQGDDMQLQPAPGQVLTAGDSLVVVGRRDRLRELSQRARSRRE